MNERERRFCEEYLVDLCARRAALRAGYAPGTARNASEWIHPGHPRKPELRAEIDRRMAERAQRIQINSDRVVQGLADIAFDEEGGGAGTRDRLRALELLGKHLGLFVAGERGERAEVALPVIVDDVEGRSPPGGDE